MTAYNVQYLVAVIARDAGIDKHLTPTGCGTAPPNPGRIRFQPC